MPCDLFGDVTDPSIKVGSRKWYTVPLSLLAHSLVLLALIVVPLLATGTLPMPTSNVVFVPMVATPVPPPPAVRRIETVTKPSANPNAPPVEAPDGITKEPLSGLEFDEGVEVGPGIADIGVVHGPESLTAPPPPPPTQPKTVRQGGDIRPPQKIRDVAAVYPPIAQAARVQGVVVVEATIGTDGQVKDAHVLRSVPLLDEAALAAVRQWVYTPTRLNGEPVSVIMTVTVHFTLQ